MKKLSIKQKRALKLAKHIMCRFDVGNITPGSVSSDFGWTQASLLELASRIYTYKP